MSRPLKITYEQRAVIKFCAKLHVKRVDTISLIRQVFGPDKGAASINNLYTVYENGKENIYNAQYSYGELCGWYYVFKNGKESIYTDKDRYDELLIDQVAAARKVDTRNTSSAWFSAAILLHERRKLKDILVEINKIEIHSRIMPSQLTTEQKQAIYDHCTDIIDTCERVPKFLDRLIVGSKTWFYKRVTREYYWPPYMPRTSQRKKYFVEYQMIPFVCFYDSKDIIYYRFGKLTTVEEGENEKEDKQAMEHLWYKLSYIRADYFESEKPRFYLLLDKSLDTIDIRKYWTERQVCVLSQPPYSPALSPCDYFLFEKIRRQLPHTKVFFDSLINFFEELKKRLNVIMIDIRKQNFEITWEICNSIQRLKVEAQKFLQNEYNYTHVLR